MFTNRPDFARFPALTAATVMGFLLILFSAVLAADDRDPVFVRNIRPLLENYCYDCHGNEGAEADLSLEQFTSIQQVIDARDSWLKVLSQLKAEHMPPEDADQPTKQERSRLLEWVDRTINEIDCSRPVDPGRVTLRRLNRNEYRNTIRDLLGIDYEPASDFPADDVGYGFDNIGDVMSLPPLLMEKYLAAAEEISRQAIAVPSWPPALQRRLQGTDLRGQGGGAAGQARALTTNGEAFGEIRFPVDGQYQVRVLAGGDQAGPEPVRMAIRLDGQDVREVDVPAGRDKPALYSVRIRVKQGKHKVGAAFLNDYYRPETKDPKGIDRNLYVAELEVRGPLDADTSKLPGVGHSIFVVRPGDKTTEDAAALQILTHLATRAYRRPVREDELDRLLGLVRLADQQGDSFEAGIRLALQAILVSPHFLFRVEADPEGEAAVRLLNDYELATRLSYFLWNSMPDETLFALARQGALRKGANLETQVRRMLQDPKSQAFIESFAGQWLQLRSLEDLAFDKQRFPTCDQQLLAAMRRETELFFSAIVHEDLSLLTVLDADFTYVNRRLAEHYGIQGVRGSEFRRVSLKGTPRMGVLTQGSVLAVTSNPTRTSPVKRGKFVLENLLGAPPPPPPANVPLLDAKGRKLTGTLRQRLVQHRANPACAACHKLMDPLGFALENFDAVGRWRSEDEGQPIDAAAALPSGEKFTGARELSQLLLRVKRDQFIDCMIQKTLIYALGRGLTYYDQCAVNKIEKALEQDDYRFSRLILGIVQSDPFQKRGKKRGRS